MRIGFLTEYSKERVEFAKKEGFDSLEILLAPESSLDIRELTKAKIKKIKEVFEQNELKVSSLICSVNHLESNKNKRRENKF